MNAARPSPVRPLLVGGVIGLILGLILGLLYAWLIDPAVYSGGAYPSDLTGQDQTNYVKFAIDEYIDTGDIVLLGSRLTTFDVVQKVLNLAAAASIYQVSGRAPEAQLVANLAATLKANEGWDENTVRAGLDQAATRPGIDQGVLSEFRRQLVPSTAPPPRDTPDQAAPAAGLNVRLLACLVLLVTVVAAALALLWFRRQRGPQRRARTPAEEALAADWDPSQPRPLRQWLGTFSLGQDNYDESFTVETADGDFLGECGMGILEFVAGSTPKQVWAFDVWLFDKTDIRTISKVLMSQEAYENEAKRGKVSTKGDLFEAEVGTTFDIETTALHVQARVDEVDESLEGHFNQLKVSLTAFLKPGVDISADMPVPEGLA